MTIDKDDNFRRMPRNEVLDEPAQQEKCDTNTGHVLRVYNSDTVECVRCGAVWKNEGF